MSVEKISTEPKAGDGKAGTWRGQAVQLLGIVLAVFLAKGAIAEPFYVPSGSMEPTLLIGDALLASKYPYGYSAASLPIQITLPETGRVLGGTPKRGDVVVFRWPGDRSQAWVKRVVGLPGDRIQMRQGQLFINDHAAELKADGIGEAEDDNGGSEPAHRYIETLPGGVRHEIFKLYDNGRLDNTPEVTVPPDRAVRDGRQPRQLRRQPRSRARRWRRTVADGRSGRPRRRRRRLLGSRHPQPAGHDLAVGLSSQPVFHGGALKASFGNGFTNSFRHAPGLSRPSTSLLNLSEKDVDARDKPGHDEF